MSASPFFFIEVYNEETNVWEKVKIFSTKGGKETEIDLWPWNGAHDLFEILGLEHGASFPEFEGVIKHSAPKNCSEEVKTFYESLSEDYGESYKGLETCVFTLADAKIYFMEYPKVKDFDAMDKAFYEASEEECDSLEDIYMDNPIKELIDRVITMVSFWDEFFWYDHTYSDVRVIGWLLW